MAPSRRETLQLVVLPAVTAVAGCSSSNPAPDTPTETSAKSPTPEPTTTKPSPKDLLPEPKGDWRLIGTEDWYWRGIGGVGGIIGNYNSPEGTLFKVVIMDSGEPASEYRAEEWACNGWDVTLAYQYYLFAAGTGTTKQTFTPEQPPHMTKSPVPSSEDESRELLTYSPLLNDQIISEHRRYCPE